MRRTRQAWLTAITGALGLAEGCHREAATSVVVVADDASPGPALVAASAPSESASVAALASAVPSAVVAPSAAVAASVTHVAPTPSVSASLTILGALGGNVDPSQVVHGPLTGGGGLGGLQNLSTQAACGASSQVRPPTADVTVHASGANGDDERVLAMLRPRFRSCANRGLQNDPTEQGTLRATITVSPTGDVSTVDGVTAAGIGSSTQACMVAQMRRAQFTAAPEHKLPIVVTTVKQP